LVATVSSTVSIYFLYLLSNEIYHNKKNSFYLVVALLFLPIVQVGFTITTTDAPLMMFWNMSVYFGYKAIFDGRLRYYILLGIAVGLGAISKYTMVLIVLSFILFALLYKKELFKSYKPYVTALIVIVIFLPVLIWNYKLNFEPIIFRYKFGSTSDYTIYLSYLGDYIVGIYSYLLPYFLYFLLSFYLIIRA
jgi:4-amino-4-deoxy-L-arabinose transferase-like glycosyltransferase